MLTAPLLLLLAVELVAAETVRLDLLADSLRVTVALPVRTDPIVLVEVTLG